MSQYSLLVLKVPLNTNQPTNVCHHIHKLQTVKMLWLLAHSVCVFTVIHGLAILCMLIIIRSLYIYIYIYICQLFFNDAPALRACHRFGDVLGGNVW